MSYMFCEDCTESIELEKLAKEKIPQILEELKLYVRADKEISIEVIRVFHGMYWSVEADLLFGGEVVRHYDSFDLLELELNEWELSILCQNRAKKGA